MKVEAKKNLEMIEEFLLLVDKHGAEAKIGIGVYGNKSVELIEAVEKLFKGRLRKELDHQGSSRWLRMHNAPKKRGYTDASLKFSVFFPNDVTKT